MALMRLVLANLKVDRCSWVVTVWARCHFMSANRVMEAQIEGSYLECVRLFLWSPVKLLLLMMIFIENRYISFKYKDE